MRSSFGEERQVDVEDKQVAHDRHGEEEESSDKQVLHQTQL
jgi:hypothetical protein